MRIFFVRDAFDRACREAERHYREGIAMTGRPNESVIYPLSFISPDAGPFQLIKLSDIETFVVTHVVVPPARFQDYGEGHAKFRGEEGEMNRVFNRMLQARIDAHPRIDVHSKMHAHPFRRGDFISGGDRKHLVDSDAAKAWRMHQGLSTIILHVMTRQEFRLGGGVWTIHNFGLDNRNRIVRLPKTEIISRRHSLARLALSMAEAMYLANPHWMSELLEAGYDCTCKVLRRGWVSYRVELGDGRTAFFTFNPSFPLDPQMFMHLKEGSMTSAVAQPEWWDGKESITRLVDWLKERK